MGALGDKYRNSLNGRGRERQNTHYSVRLIRLHVPRSLCVRLKRTVTVDEKQKEDDWKCV